MSNVLPGEAGDCALGFNHRLRVNPGGDDFPVHNRHLLAAVRVNIEGRHEFFIGGCDAMMSRFVM
jgi:hypothetical protein